MVTTSKIFAGSAKEYTEWVKNNLTEISKACGLGEISSLRHETDVYKDSNGVVGRLSVMFDDKRNTDFICEPNNWGTPIAALLKAIFAIKASVESKELKSTSKVRKRWIVVSPEIDEKLVLAAQEENLPISFLQANIEECKYWQCKLTALWE